MRFQNHVMCSFSITLHFYYIFVLLVKSVYSFWVLVLTFSANILFHIPNFGYCFCSSELYIHYQYSFSFSFERKIVQTCSLSKIREWGSMRTIYPVSIIEAIVISGFSNNKEIPNKTLPMANMDMWKSTIETLMYVFVKLL